MSGIPPAVDLPAHAAQMQTLAELVRGAPDVSRVYEAGFPVGYGLPVWLFLPLTLLTNGAVAARAAVWTALVLFPLGHLALARALGRTGWTVVLALPLAFHLSYWYGFLPSFFAVPFVLLGFAAYVRALDAPTRAGRGRALAALALLALGAMLSHLVAFGMLGVGVVALALASPLRGEALRRAALGLAPATLLCATRVLALVGRAAAPGSHLPSSYDAASHVNFLFRAYRPEGLLAVAGPLLVTAVFVVAGWVHRRQEPRRPWALFLALTALYVATPKALSGAWLIHVRVAVLAGAAALLLVDPARLARPLRVLLVGIVLLSLVETARFHVRFAREVEGLEALTAAPPPAGAHGYLSLPGLRLGEKGRLTYLEHLGQWWTGRQGGVGHHFFADADHQPVRFREGQELPARLDATAPPEDFAPFSALLVYGEGPLPAALSGFRETARAGRWRRLDRP
ncbi:MAG: hypothetical protein JXB05_10920 [Myxococcaceae bacterium]|nr:hypothetical protein [Myxococcaceae bacterium]